MPDWLQPLTMVNPLRHFLVMVKGVFLKGLPAGEVLRNTVPLDPHRAGDAHRRGLAVSSPDRMITAASIGLTRAVRQLLDKYPRQTQWQFKVAARTSGRLGGILRASIAMDAVEIEWRTKLCGSSSSEAAA